MKDYSFVIPLMSGAIVIMILIIGGLVQPHFYDRIKRRYARKLIKSLKLKEVKGLDDLLSETGRVILEQFTEDQNFFSVTHHQMQLPKCNYFGEFRFIWICNGLSGYALQSEGMKSSPFELNYYDRLLIKQIVDLVRARQTDTEVVFTVKFNGLRKAT